MILRRKKLPIGIQTFRKIREDAYYYVDKTRLALQLVEEGGNFFLSRPRRFGKSLFLDTLKELFEGNEDLFKGLYAADRWDWSRRHPVIRISFGTGVLQSREDLEQRIREILTENARRLGVEPEFTSVGGFFSQLIAGARERHGERVVVLIDEYDKPILDNIENAEVATVLRDCLRDLFSVLKDADPDLRFVLLTGVSKFSKVSLFSGLNNLRDITLDARYSAICGYTEADVDSVFAEELPGLDREKIRRWYNGYNWLGEAVYNPFDLLLLFDSREFRAWWYETGTPSFLLKLLRQRPSFLPNLDQLQASESLLSTFDVGNIPVESLMFQAGYLTIDRAIHRGEKTWYRLRYPNQEVFQSLNESLLMDWTHNQPVRIDVPFNLYGFLESADFEGMGRLLSGFYESIPHQWYTNNAIAHYEGYYASVFYAFFASLGLDITVEESSNAGRLDMVVRFGGWVLIFEFKLVEAEATAGGNSALAAIRDRGYVRRFQGGTARVVCIGIEFSKQTRRIVAWDVETV